MVTARVRLHHTGVNGKAETCVHACSHHALEYLPEQIAPGSVRAD